MRRSRLTAVMDNFLTLNPKPFAGGGAADCGDGQQEASCGQAQQAGEGLGLVRVHGLVSVVQQRGQERARL